MSSFENRAEMNGFHRINSHYNLGYFANKQGMQDLGILDLHLSSIRIFISGF